MTLDMWITIGVLVGALVLFVTEWLRLDVVALLAVIVLMVTQVLTPTEALAGFSSSIVMLLASLFIVGGAVLRTGLASSLSDQLLRLAGTNQTRLLIVIMVAVAVMSAFISNTGTVAVLLPAVLALAASTKVNPSKLLIPLAFSSSLGGAMTLIGTPPNLIISEQLQEAGFTSFQFFSFMPIGVVLVVVGIAFMVIFGDALLPDHQTQRTRAGASSEDLAETYHLDELIYRVRVRSVSPLIGKTLRDTEFSHRYNVTVMEILRPNPPHKVASFGQQQILIQRQRSPIHPRGATVLLRDDVLILRATEESVQEICRKYNLALQPRSAKDQATLISQEEGIAEVVIPPESAFINKSVEELRFSTTYNLTVMDIRRAGAEASLNILETPLQFGDVLLVQGKYEDLARAEENPNMVLLSPEAITARVFNRRKAPITLLVLLGMLILLVTQWVDPVVATMLAALAIILTNCMTIDEAYDTIDWKSIILIGGMLPLSTALIKVGLVDTAASWTADMLGDASPVIILGALYLLTVVLTQVLSNTATSVLLAPVAIAIAGDLGVRPQALMMAIAIAASMAFATPMASPVNTLVMSAGRYSFRDYAKIGVPLIGVMFVVTMVILPVLFPF